MLHKIGNDRGRATHGRRSHHNTDLAAEVWEVSLAMSSIGLLPVNKFDKKTGRYRPMRCIDGKWVPAESVGRDRLKQLERAFYDCEP